MLSLFAPKPGLSAEQVETLPERVSWARTFEFVGDLKRRVLLIPPERREGWVLKQVERIPEAARKRASMDVLRYAAKKDAPPQARQGAPK
jgi:hypothetical protein